MVILLILGIVAFVVGMLSIFSDRFDNYVSSLFPRSQIDDRYISKEDQYFMRRYLSGLRGILGGLLMIALYVLSEPQALDTLMRWYRTIAG
jgi:hypothetical protein